MIRPLACGLATVLLIGCGGSDEAPGPVSVDSGDVVDTSAGGDSSVDTNVSADSGADTNVGEDTSISADSSADTSVSADSGADTGVVEDSGADTSVTADADAGADTGADADAVAADSGSDAGLDACAGCSIGGACIASGTFHPTSGCQACDPTKSTTGWSVRPGTCLIGGVCYPAGATDGTKTCRVCEPAASNTAFVTRLGTCFIGDTCYANGALNGTNICQQCLPCDATPVSPDARCTTLSQRTQSKQQWTNMPGSTVCLAGDSCYNPAGCSSGTCGARALKQDGDESNNTTSTATTLTDATDCEGTARSASGLLSGSGDEDWYKLRHTDSTACTMDPSITANTSGQSAEVCVFTKCSKRGNLSMTCSDGSAASTAISGYMGCCKSGIDPSFAFAPKCMSSLPAPDDDSVDAYIAVRNLSSTAVCANHSFTIKF